MQAKSRIDTWQTSESLPRSTKNQLINRPIQVAAKSRIDTWQTSTVRRRARSVTEVRHVHL